ncbi:MAG TPA: hypothetical protein VFE22_15135 [Edaphobacter sp.]|nr:hypothetical protein [Edaphobacter sp.]
MLIGTLDLLIYRKSTLMAEPGLSTLTLIWEATTKLSEDAIEAARSKALSLSFDIDKGLVGFAETRINLIHSRDVISDAVEHEKLVQLPLSLQTDLLQLLDGLVEHLTAVADGKDEIVLFAGKVEQLSVFLWQYGFYNLSNEVLGYQRKLNRLKSLEVESDGLIGKLQASQVVNEAASNVLLRVQEAEVSIKTISEESAALKKQIADAASIVAGEHQTVSAALASVKQQNEDGARLIATITTIEGQAKTNGEQIATLLAQTTARIEELKAAVLAGQQGNSSIKTTADALAEKLSTDSEKLKKDQREEFAALQTRLEDAAKLIIETSSATITTFEATSQKNLAAVLQNSTASLEMIGKDWQAATDTLLTEETEKLQSLTGELKNLELQIKDQIEKAIGFSLFGAFQKRQESIVTSKKFWQWALFVCVGAGVALGVYFLFTFRNMPSFNYLYLAKLALSLPVIYAISFCSIQYSKERRLEEEYAFKASISVSLNPYQELVGRLVDMKVPEERAKYADFIISSIESVFSSPTDKVYEVNTASGESKGIENAVKQLGPILDPLAKLFGHK